MFRRMIHLIAIAALVAGCASGTKLNDVPVTDLSGPGQSQGQGQGQGQNPGQGAGTASGGVTPLIIDPAAPSEQGPAGVARIIYFDYDSYIIKFEFQSLLDAHARFLKANAQRRISIEGHTDERGGREYNLALGQKRSEAVRRALALLGVADAQIEAVSFGSEKPAVQGANEQAWARNRRAEITYR